MNRNNEGRAKNQTREANDKSIKVKYISSPVLVEAKNPSQFKEIVQHYTGKDPNETTYDMYSNSTTVTATATTTTTTTVTTEAPSDFFYYGATQNMNVPQVGIDGYSWEEIAEWNRNR